MKGVRESTGRLKAAVTVSVALIVLLVSIVAFPPLIGAAQETSEEEWSRVFGGSGVEFVNSVDQTSDNGYVFTGGTMSWGSGYMDVWLVKTDQAGNLVWNKTFGTDEYDEGFSVQQTADEGYIVTGYCSLRGSGYRDSKLWLIKTYADGEMEWNKTFTEIANTTVSWSEGSSVRQTNDGGFIIAGIVQLGNSAIWLIKTDSSGNKTWEHVLAASNNIPSKISVRQNTDGGYIVAGNVYPVSSPYGDIILIKMDTAGAILWNKTHGGAGSEYAYSVQQTNDGGYIVAGSIYSGYDTRGWVIRTDAFGERIWEIVFDPDDYASAAEQTSDGGYIVFGASRDKYSRRCVRLTKTDGEGNRLSEKLIESCPYCWARDGKQTNDGGYIITAYNALSEDAVLIYTANVFHDIRIDSITLPKKVVGQVFTAEINIAIQNQGNFTETFNVTAYANSTAVETQESTLAGGTSTTVLFTWSTADVAKGNYTISAYAWPVSSEADIADNTLVNGLITITIPGDVDGDYDVDIFDIVKLAKDYGKPPPIPLDYNCDIDGDGDIDIFDIVIAAGNYGESW